MALRTIRIGGNPDIIQYDDGDYDKSIEVDDPIKVNAAPVLDEDVLRKGDMPGIGEGVSSDANIPDNAVVRGDGGARKVQGSAVSIDDDGNIILPAGKSVDGVDVSEYVNNDKEEQGYTESPMIVSGGEVIEGTNAGTFKVEALVSLLRITDSLTGKLERVTKDLEDNIAITLADTTYYVCLNYNAGSPTISLSTSSPYEADKRNIPIGKVRRDALNNVHYISSGFRFQDGVRKLHKRAKELREIELENGSTIHYLATDKFTMETGVVYSGLNRFPLSSYNSNTTQFTMLYKDGLGGWTEVNRNTIDCSHYDDGSGVLATIGNNKYGNHYIYKHIDDEHVYEVLGTDSYSLAEAVLNTIVAPTVPSYLNDFGCLIGCIIAPKAGGSFTKVVMVTSQFFSGVEVANHANLSNLDYASSGHIGFAKDDGSNLAIGSDADGDIYYRALGVLARLAKGTANLKLFMNAGAIAPEWAVGMKIGTFTKDTADATGTQEISGVGFKPSFVIFFAVTNVAAEASFGFDDGSNAYSIDDWHNRTADTWSYSVVNSIQLNQAAGIIYSGVISVLGADGFTITWTKAGAKTGSAYIHYMAFR